MSSHPRTYTRQANPAANPGGSLTVTDTHPSPDQNEGASGSEPPFAVLRLRGGPVSRRRVVWDEEVVDNEHLGRKSSKICCIYHKPRKFDESSSESSSSGSSSSDDDAPRRPLPNSDKAPRSSGEETDPENERRVVLRKRKDKGKKREKHQHQHGESCSHPSQPDATISNNNPIDDNENLEIIPGEDEGESAYTIIRARQLARSEKIMNGQDSSDDDDSVSSSSSAARRREFEKKAKKMRGKKPKPFEKTKPNRYEVGLE